MDQVLLKFLRPGTFIAWGFILVIAAYIVAHHAEPHRSFFVRHLFAVSLVSWSAGLVLAIRIHFRRHGDRKRSFFG